MNGKLKMLACFFFSCSLVWCPFVLVWDFPVGHHQVLMDENSHLHAALEALSSSKMQTEHSHRGLEANLATVSRDLEHRVNKQATLEEHLAGLRQQLPMSSWNTFCCCRRLFFFFPIRFFPNICLIRLIREKTNLILRTHVAKG